MPNKPNGKHFGGSEPEKAKRGGHFSSDRAADQSVSGRHAATSANSSKAAGRHVSTPVSSGQASARHAAGAAQPASPVQPAAARHATNPSHAAGAHSSATSNAEAATTRIASPIQPVAAGRHSSKGGSRYAATSDGMGLRRKDARKANRASGQRFAQTDAGGARGNGSSPYAPNDGGKKPRRKGNVLSTVLIVVGVALLLVAGGLYIHAQLDYAATDANNEKLASYATVSDDAAEADGCPITVDWESLKAVNDDVVGWIYIPGTNVNFPVYQGETNDTYLRTTATGEYAVGGQIFMDYENARPGLVDRQTLIYGHHLNNGAMFAQIDEFANQSGLEQLQTIWYLTETATYELEPLCFYKTAATNGDARTVTWASDDDFHSYLTGLVDQATAKNDEAVSAISSLSKVLTLCTCDYENDFGQSNGRGLLVCALKSELNGTASTDDSQAAAGETTSADAVDLDTEEQQS